MSSTFKPYSPGNVADPDTPIRLIQAMLAPNSGFNINTNFQNLSVATSVLSTFFYDGSITQLGIGSGLLFTTGTEPGPTNSSSGFGADNGQPGNAALDTVVAGKKSFNAATFGFELVNGDPNIKGFKFDLVFASEEYPEYVNSFPDIGAVFVNGVNYALFNGQADQPLSVLQKNLSAGNFNDNAANKYAPWEYDGISSKLTIVAPLSQGVNFITIAIGDLGDSILDSGMIISNVSATATATGGLFVDVLGDDNANTQNGTANNEIFNAGGGGDNVNAGGGNDILNGQGGDDNLNGGTGNDEINGGEGDDMCTGDAGADRMDGGTGTNTLNYGAENGGTKGVSVDLFTGLATDSFNAVDTLLNFLNVLGTLLDDDIRGTQGGNVNNNFKGGAGKDLLVGWEGDDTLEGEGGDDVLVGWTDNDTLKGGDNNDFLWLGSGNDTGQGDAGDDVIVGDLPGSTETGDDTLVGGLGSDILLGGAGNDTLFGGLQDTSDNSDTGARDWLIGGAGNDTVYGASGDDVIWEQLDVNQGGNDTVFGGDGNDLILTGNGVDTINGGAGVDTIYGGAGGDTITTGANNDLVWLMGTGDFGDTVTDFVSGQDRMVLYPVLTAGTTAAAFASGVFSLLTSGANTNLMFDADGAAGAGLAVLAVTFTGRTVGSFNTAVDFI